MPSKTDPNAQQEIPPGVKILPGSRVLKHEKTLRGWKLHWWHAQRFARQITRWWRPRMMSRNAPDGWITTDIERWSWRRWRWEPYESRRHFSRSNK